jgi:acyl-CoA carboxylase subunit beta
MTETVAAPAWVLCPACRAIQYDRRLARDLRVCPGCGHHHRLDAATRIAQLLDADGVEWPAMTAHSADVLGFTDSAPYPARLARARAATGLAEGVLVAAGTIHGHPVVVAAMDFRFMGGSLGVAVGEYVTRAAGLALARRVPLLLVSASGGARMQEGALALMQMARTSQALAALDEAGVLTISLITDPTYGGVAASYATLCDVLIAEPGAHLGFAGPRVIEQTIGERLPAGFQTAEFLLAHGLIDAIRPRRHLRTSLGRLLATGGRGRHSPGYIDDPVVRDPDLLPERDAWQVVQDARDLARPSTMDYVRLAFEDFEELRGDRVSGDCPAIVGGTARLGGRPVMVIGQQKGHTLAELVSRDHGMATPAGYRKAARLMRMAAKLGLSVVTLIDTPGAYPGVAAEEHGQAVAIAESIRLMSGLPVPVVAVVIGEGGSGGALALGVADEVLMCADATYSVISPEGCASILWRDRAKAPDAARALCLDARRLLRLGVVDGVLPAPGRDTSGYEAAARDLRAALDVALDRLSTMDGRERVAVRRARFASFGADTLEDQ